MRLSRVRRARCFAAMAAAAAMAASGCSWLGDDGPDEDPAAQSGYPRSWIWYAAAGTTLDSADARAVRGWVESQTLYQDSRVSYPGFTDATSAELLRGMTGADSDTQGGGTERYRIRSLTVRGTELRASLCSDGWDEFGFDADGKFVDAGTELAVRELVMRKERPSDAGSPSALRQSFAGEDQAGTSPTPAGRLPYQSWLKGPTTNVFDGWVAVSWDVTVTPSPDCATWFEGNHPGLKVPTGYTDDKRPNRPTAPPPPTFPPSPGW